MTMYYHGNGTVVGYHYDVITTARLPYDCNHLVTACQLRSASFDALRSSNSFIVAMRESTHSYHLVTTTGIVTNEESDLVIKSLRDGNCAITGI
jgi:hypothetical protein